MRKRISTFLGLTAAVCTAVSGCSSQPAATSTEAPAETTETLETTKAETETQEAERGTYIPGTYTATA